MRSLPDDLVDSVLTAAMTDPAPGAESRSCRDEHCDRVVRLHDTVFFALVSRAFAKGVRDRLIALNQEALARLGCSIAPADAGLELRPRLVTSIAGIFLSPARFRYTRKHLGVPERLPSGLAAQHMRGYDYSPTSMIYKQRWQASAGRLQAFADRFARGASASASASGQPVDMAFAGCLLTPSAIQCMLQSAPIGMLRTCFGTIIGPSRTFLEGHSGRRRAMGGITGSVPMFEELHLVMGAAYHGRTDVLDHLVHVDPDRARAYDSKHGIMDMLCTIDNVHVGRRCPGPLFDFLLEPAVLGDRPEVLAWLREASADIHRRYYSKTPAGSSRGHTHFETAPFLYEATSFPSFWGREKSRESATRLELATLGRQPFGPSWYRSSDFTSLFILAVQSGSVRVLDWMYNSVERGNVVCYLRTAPDRAVSEVAADQMRYWLMGEGKPGADLRTALRAHIVGYQCAMIVAALTGGVAGTGARHETHSSCGVRRGCVARWGMRKWRALLARIGKPALDATRLGAFERFDPLAGGYDLDSDSRADDHDVDRWWRPTSLRGLFHYLCKEGLVYMGSERLCLHSAKLKTLPAMMKLLFSSSLGFFDAVVCVVGDEDRMRWLCEESLLRDGSAPAALGFFEDMFPQSGSSVEPLDWIASLIGVAYANDGLIPSGPYYSAQDESGEHKLVPLWYKPVNVAAPLFYEWALRGVNSETEPLEKVYESASFRERMLLTIAQAVPSLKRQASIHSAYGMTPNRGSTIYRWDMHYGAVGSMGHLAFCTSDEAFKVFAPNDALLPPSYVERLRYTLPSTVNAANNVAPSVMRGYGVAVAEWFKEYWDRSFVGGNEGVEWLESMLELGLPSERDRRLARIPPVGLRFLAHLCQTKSRGWARPVRAVVESAMKDVDAECARLGVTATREALLSKELTPWARLHTERANAIYEAFDTVLNDLHWWGS